MQGRQFLSVKIKEVFYAKRFNKCIISIPQLNDDISEDTFQKKACVLFHPEDYAIDIFKSPNGLHYLNGSSQMQFINRMIVNHSINYIDDHQVMQVVNAGHYDKFMEISKLHSKNGTCRGICCLLYPK